MALLLLQDIDKEYRMGKGRVLRVLDHISLSVERGEFVAIMGPSGSGKSTLMNIIGCLDAPTQGIFRLGDQSITSLKARDLVHVRRKSIGFIFQSFHLLPRLNALQNVELPLIYSGGAHRRDRARAALRSVGLEDRAHHRPSELSGGEQQRVAIARALVNDPMVILADEPTGNLDSASGKEILRLFRQLNEEGRTIVMVTHDAELAKLADRIVHIHDGRLVP